MDIKGLRDIASHFRIMATWLASICEEETINGAPLTKALGEVERMERGLGLLDWAGGGSIPVEQLALLFGLEPTFGFFENVGNDITSFGDFKDIVTDIHRFTGRMLRERMTTTSTGAEITECERLFRYFRLFRMFRDKTFRAVARKEGVPAPDLTDTRSPLQRLLDQLDTRLARSSPDQLPPSFARSGAAPVQRIDLPAPTSGDSEPPLATTTPSPGASPEEAPPIDG